MAVLSKPKRPSPAQRRIRAGCIHAHRAQAGFTLLETMVALVLLGFLMTGLTQGLRFGVSAWQSQMRIFTERGDLDAAERTLRTLIGRMDAGGLSGRPPAFEGTERRLAFRTALPQAAAGLVMGDADVALTVDDGRRLLLLWQPHYQSRIQAASPPDRVVLLQDVDDLTIAYWPDARAGWQAEWAGPALPKLIRIRVAHRQGSGRHGLDIVVKPMRDSWRE